MLRKIFVYSLFILPFLILIINFPMVLFYNELTAVFLALVFVVLLLKVDKIAIPNVAICTLSFAAILILQLVFLSIRIPGINLGIAFLFLIATFFSISITSFIAGDVKKQQQFITTIACAVLIGTTIQAIYGYLQFVGLAENFPNFIVYIGSMGDAICGNFGFKGDFDCYLMLGVFSLVYLYSKQKINLPLFLFYQFFYLLIITITSARAVILVFILTTVMVIAYTILYRKKNADFIFKTKLFMRAFAITLILYFLLNILVPLVFNYLMHHTNIGNIITGLNPHALSGSVDYNNINSALHRFTDRTDYNADGSYRRIYEWYKALYLFITHPLLGVGWYQYPREAIYLMESTRFMYIPAYPGIFSNPHNFILTVLAETGIIGFIVAIGFGIFYSLYRLFKNFANIETLFISLMVLDIFAFGQVEYPLWYTYFLLYFIMFLSIDKPIITLKNNKTMKLAIGFFILMMFFVLETSLFTYNKLSFYAAIIPKDQDLFSHNVEDLENIANNNILWRYPALKVLSMYINPDFQQINLAMPLNKQVYYRGIITEEFPSPLVILHQIILNKIAGNNTMAINYANLLAHGYPNRRDEMIKILKDKGGFDEEIKTMQKFDYHEHNIFVK